MIQHVVVKLVTPAMIGGARPRECDSPPLLRPPSVRGHLGFWTKALRRGKNLEPKELWGDVDRGQRVSLLGLQPFDLKLQDAHLFPPKGTMAQMIPPSHLSLLRFRIPPSVDLDRFRAVLWVWLHLGTVGRRSRRGYGSLHWIPSQGDLLEGWPPLWPNHHLDSRGSLVAYLKAGLTRVGEVLGIPNGTDARTATVDSELLSQDQVFVGKELPGVWEATDPKRHYGGLEAIVHGRNELGRDGPPDSLQLGSSKGTERQPSPMMWRLFRLAGMEAYVPVMTWFPTGYEPSAPVVLQKYKGVYQYLNGKLGFEKSLIGNDLAA